MIPKRTGSRTKGSEWAVGEEPAKKISASLMIEGSYKSIPLRVD